MHCTLLSANLASADTMTKSFAMCNGGRHAPLDDDGDEAERSDEDDDEVVATYENPFCELYRRQRLHPPAEGRTLYFSRHGESEYNVEERLGGDPDLTPRGHRYAKALGHYINALDLPDLKIWTSDLRRTHQTAAVVRGPRTQISALDELSAGFMDGLTYGDVERSYPQEYMAREKDKLRYKYPGGESYLDCCQRLLPVLSLLESEHNVLVVAHQAVLRCVFAFLLHTPLDALPYVKIPQHALMQVTFDGGENVVDFIRMPIEHADHTSANEIDTT